MPIKGYQPAQKSKFRRIVMSTEALDKEGKTEFILSAPGPIALLNFDVGLEGVIEKHLKKKKIEVAEFDYREVTNYKEWEKMWERSKMAFVDALHDKATRTIGVDTATEWWELARMAAFGKLTQVLPHNYGPVNAEFRDLIRKAYDFDKNVIFSHKMKEQYVNDKGTGKMIRAGFGDMQYSVQINVRLWRNKEKVFGLTVINSRHNAALMGMELEDSLSNFPTLASEVFPETSPQDWGAE